MAVMHPVDIENYDYTPTEKDLYYALKEQLPDKYQVFYSVRWFETVENKRIDSESDFLVFDPSFGFITIEVKGGTGITVVSVGSSQPHFVGSIEPIIVGNVRANGLKYKMPTTQICSL